MGIPQLEFCCCGCTLKQGSLIIGWLQTVCGIISIIGVIIVLAMGDDVKGEVPTTNSDVLLMTRIINLVVTAITTAISIVLLVGINSNRLSFVRIWVIFMSVLLILDVVGMVVLFFLIGVFALIYAVFLALGVYFVWVVHSYYRQEMRSAGNF